MSDNIGYKIIIFFLIIMLGYVIHQGYKDNNIIYNYHQEYVKGLHERMQINNAGLKILQQYEYDLCKDWASNSELYIKTNQCEKYLYK